MNEITIYNALSNIEQGKNVTIKKIVEQGGGEAFKKAVDKIIAKCVILLNRKDMQFNEVLADEFSKMVVSEYNYLQPKEMQDAVVEYVKNADPKYFVLSIQTLKCALDDYCEQREAAWIATQENFD